MAPLKTMLNGESTSEKKEKNHPQQMGPYQL